MLFHLGSNSSNGKLVDSNLLETCCIFHPVRANLSDQNHLSREHTFISAIHIISQDKFGGVLFILKNPRGSSGVDSTLY